MEKDLELKNYTYNLPKELIAQVPYTKRDEARLYYYNKQNNEVKDLLFKDIIDLLDDNMVLVLNETKVVRARFFAFKKDTKAKIEVLYLNHVENNLTALVKPAKRLKEDTTLIINDSKLELKVISKNIDGTVLFKANLKNEALINEINKIGIMPLPPYIKEKLAEQDFDKYQTVYANKMESSAAPTAGLHFTNELLEKIKNKKIEILKVSLKIGLDTFKPIKEKNILDHKMHTESYFISESVADKLNKAKEENKKIVAVGTTVVRTLEANISKFNKFKAGEYKTDIFIYPGYKFKAVDHLITNFHLPESTLLCLVSAFTSREKILSLYNDAVKKQYHFFSFGDAMFIK